MMTERCIGHWIRIVLKGMLGVGLLLGLLACGSPASELGVKKAAFTYSPLATNLVSRQWVDSKWSLVGAIIAPQVQGGPMPERLEPYHITCVWKRAAKYYSDILAVCRFPSAGHGFQVTQSTINRRDLLQAPAGATRLEELQSALDLLRSEATRESSRLIRSFAYFQQSEQNLADGACRKNTPEKGNLVVLASSDRCEVRALDVIDDLNQFGVPHRYVSPQDRPDPLHTNPIWATSEVSWSKHNPAKHGPWQCNSPTIYQTTGPSPGEAYTPHGQCQNP